MVKIQHSVNRFVGDEDPKVRLCEEFFLKALSPAQVQWIRIQINISIYHPLTCGHMAAVLT
jgi:hypothetical protein